ncbi:MAG: GNAT family N-acetyltransferase [Deltaproteobacteria bacterium]|nr:GNAT family N-acetyltransferase [Deltaproteobacteria bacterium]
MRRIQVVPVSLPQDVGRMVEAWWTIHGEDAEWSPPLLKERRRFLDPERNPWLQRWEVQFFLALSDGRPVGTISAQIDPSAQEEEPGVGYFGFFEFVDDEGVARSLLAAAAGWLMERGMELIRGPYNFIPGQGFGLKVSGPSCACLLDPQARGYYPAIYERLGFSVRSTWTSWWFDTSEVEGRVERVADRVLTQSDLTLRPLDTTRWDSDMADILTACDASGEARCGDLVALMNHLRDLIEPDLVWLAYHEGVCVGASLAIPDLTPVIRKMKGKMLPFGWYHWWFGRQRIQALRLIAVRVDPELEHKGLSAALYQQTREAARKLGVLGMEYPPVRDDDHAARRFLSRMGGKKRGTYHVYEAEITTELTEEVGR